MSVSQQLKNKIRQKRRRKYEKLVKSQLKKIDRILTEKNLSLEETNQTISETQKVLDKATRKGIIHPNRSNSYKSKRQKIFNQ